MFGIAAIIVFALAYLFHGFGFAGNAWISPGALTILGLFLLAVHLVAGAAIPVIRIRSGQ